MPLTPSTNNLKIEVFDQLPIYAVDIRNEVFVKEQGFQEEFDEADETALHIVGFIDNISVATSRIIKHPDETYMIGRIAVRKSYRGLGLGAEIIKAAEKIISERGGRTVYIHAQTRVVPFYEKQGYFPIGFSDEEEGCPHEMLKKHL